MDNEDFIEFVLDEKHYLSFYDEIVLFTGLKRDRIDILKKLIERLSEAYSELSSQIEKIDDKHDSFFEIENSFAEQLDRGFLACIGDKREEVKKELEIIEDKMLESTMPSEAVKKKQYQITPFQKLERIWTLAAKVLRNTEETEEGKLKKEALGAVIKASMSFACLYKYLFIQHLRDKKDKIGDEEKEDARLIVNFMPLLHQVLVYDCLASSKLHVVLREYIEEILRDKSATQFEKYLAVFTFSDGKGKDYLDYIKKYIKQIKGKYMFDMTLFKLISYYFLRSETKISDSEYENLISEIIVAVQGKPKRMKSHVIQSYRKKRKSYKDSQTTFDFN